MLAEYALKRYCDNLEKEGPFLAFPLSTYRVCKMSNSDAVEHFTSVTGATREAAEFYLDSAGGSVEAAVDAYFAADGAVTPQPEEQRPAKAEPSRPRLPNAADTSAPSAAKRPPQAAGGGKFKSLADFRGGDADEEEDESNEYYTGGEKSGQVVKGDNKDSMDSLFERARHAGAEVGTSADLQLPGATRPAAFSGKARTLGGSDQPSAEVNAPEPTPADQPVIHNITFWANNVFTVNNGEPRSMTDPTNRPFLEAIGRGECPTELMPANPDALINVNLVRSAQEYHPPEQPRHVAFSGQGRTLAGIAPSASAAATSSAAEQEAGSNSEGWEGVDESKPTTSIQLRLADGSRLVARFNHSQTVGDIRRFIAASRPDMPRGYSMMTAFPATPLTDDSKTISESGLLNAVIIQKM